MKKRMLAIILGLAMVLGLAACSSGGSGADAGSGDAASGSAAQSSDAGDAGDGNTVILAVGAGFDTLDPGQAYEKYPTMIINACYDTLFRFYTDDGAAEPCLAESYEFSDDGLTLTIKLKEEACFASGNPVEADDVVFTINRVKNLKGNPAFIVDTVETVEAADEHTVVFNLNQPDSAIISKLTYASTAILDSEVVIANGGTDAEDAASADTARDYLTSNSAGSGMFVITSYIQDEEIILEKNENYWGEPTNIDTFVVKIQPDSNTQMMTLASGDIDIALNLTQDTMEELEGNDNVVLLNSPTKTIGFVMMNMDEAIGGPVADPTVQKAIRLALDYEGIQMICGEGTITPYSIIQTGFLGSMGELPAGYRDIDAALALMAEAGYPDGFSVDLTVCDLDMQGVVLTDLAQKVASDLADININVNIVTQAWAGGYGDAYREGSLGFTVMYWGVDYCDPNVQLSFLPGETVGLRAGWTAEMDPELVALNKKILETTDNDDRAALLLEVQERIYEGGPFIVVAQSNARYGYRSRLTGIVAMDSYTMDMTQIRVVE